MPESPSNVARLSNGTIEYATRGTGAAVIVCHSTGGGYDQGLMIARLLQGFTAIAVSRAGYLRTPLETGRSPADLADAYALLLDSLQIEKAGVLGLSGGGMSPAHFALRQPDRCWGLVLADAITKTPPNSSVKIVRQANSSPDRVAWFLTRLAVYGVLPLTIRDAETRAMMRVFFENNPLSKRHAGVQNDLEQVAAMHGFRWEEIRVPTLLIHGEKDRLIPLTYSQEIAHRIAGAELVVVHGGGHECLISHHRQVKPVLQAFLATASTS